MARHAFHVINVTFFGSRGTSSANSLSLGSTKVSIPRLARFREDSNLGSCINFKRKPRRTNSSQGARAASESFVTTSQLWRRLSPTYYRSTLNETLFERNCFQARFLVFQTKTRRRRASQGIIDTRQSTTRAAGICLASDCQFRKSRCPNRTSFNHKRM